MHCQKNLLRKIITFAFLIVNADIAHSHHSTSMFDKNVIRHVDAVVKEFQWTNPHVWIQIYIENQNGKQEEWSIEGLGTNGLFRKGWRPNSFKPGDIIEIKFNPMLDGSSAGGFIGAKLTNGKIFGRW